MEEIEEEMGPTVWANSRVKEGDLGKGEVREKLGIKFRRVLELWSSGQRLRPPTDGWGGRFLDSMNTDGGVYQGRVREK